MPSQKRIEEFLTKRGRIDARKLMFSAHIYDASEKEFGMISLFHNPNHHILPGSIGANYIFKMRHEDKNQREVSLCGDKIFFSKINYNRINDKLSLGAGNSPSFNISEIRIFNIVFIDEFAKIRIFFHSDAFAFFYLRKEDIHDVFALLNEIERHEKEVAPIPPSPDNTK